MQSEQGVAPTIGAATAAALHLLVLSALLAYEPTRSAFIAAAPIMVDWISAPKREEAHPEPPKPKPVRKVPKPVEPPPVAALPTAAQAPLVAPEPPPPPQVEPAPAAPMLVTVTPPIFNADYLDNPAPEYPVLSRRLREQGRVVLRVLVNGDGGADEAHVIVSSGHARLDASARETVRRWKFVPAKRGAEPVAAWVLVPVSFGLDG